MMKKITLSLVMIIALFSAQAQQKDSLASVSKNIDNVTSNESRLSIGGYGEVYYNQPIGTKVHQSGTLNVERLVLLMGYKFNNRTQFVTEIEFEDVKEAEVEQAFLQYKLNNWISLKGGLLLIPMGIINDFHEPTSFLGVTRPLVDRSIVPTTWREVGAGFTGGYLPASVKYQCYVVNGFNGFDGQARLGGVDGFRSGRQDGADSYITSPNLAAKVEYYGIRGLNLGLSGYFGKSQSTLYEGVDKADKVRNAIADSSVVGITMIGVDARYNKGGLQLRAQGYFTALSNTQQYNAFSLNQSKNLGSQMTGYYFEAGYNVLKSLQSTKLELIPFVRYEKYDTQHTVAQGVIRNPAYNVDALLGGVSLKLAKGAVVKADMLFRKSEASSEWTKTLNIGLGVMF